MWGSPFEICLINLCQLLPKQSLYYQTQMEAYEELKKISGEDFGYDATKWEQWGLQNNQFLPGWQGLDAINHIRSGGSSQGSDL
jgi:hypothetical protein